MCRPLAKPGRRAAVTGLQHRGRNTDVRTAPALVQMAEAEPMTLELHYPANWAYDGEVEVLHLDGKGEKSYGRCALV